MISFRVIRETISRLHGEPGAQGIEPRVTPREAPVGHGAAQAIGAEANGVDRRRACARTLNSKKPCWSCGSRRAFTNSEATKPEAVNELNLLVRLEHPTDEMELAGLG